MSSLLGVTREPQQPPATPGQESKKKNLTATFCSKNLRVE